MRIKSPQVQLKVYLIFSGGGLVSFQNTRPTYTYQASETPRRYVVVCSWWINTWIKVEKKRRKLHTKGTRLIHVDGHEPYQFHSNVGHPLEYHQQLEPTFFRELPVSVPESSIVSSMTEWLNGWRLNRHDFSSNEQCIYRCHLYYINIIY